ncbi:heme exporter protein CcmD [Sinimarinibacterium sp. NLF-5-8]|nr:heme exporter protein CcmD [Sinimarinibacterium sp. NLF-5-8]
MSGYATYVWGSFGFSAVVFAWCVFAPRARRRQLLEDIRES